MSDLKQTWANFIAHRVSSHFAGVLNAQARFLKDTSGSVLIYVGLTSFVFLGFAGLAVDVGHWYASKRTMQSAADAAALGGVFAVKQGSDKATIVGMAKSDAALHCYDLTMGAVGTINHPPSRGPSAGGRTEVRYAASCSAKSSHDGIETTRVGTPCASIPRWAASASGTSEPVAIRTATCSPPGDSPTT